MYNSIRPGRVWLDTEGKRIQAHGGSIIEVASVYYWYGENKEKTTGEDNIWHWGVRCYSSKDLYNWKDEGIIIPPDTENQTSPLHPSAMMDRPHIVYNKRSRKYIAWLKIMGEPPYFTVLEANHILGPYSIIKLKLNPCGLEVGDFDIAVDEENEKAYLFSEKPHTMLYCVELNTTYTDTVGEHWEYFPHNAPPATREAPAHFSRDGRHYLITSGTTGYHPNPSEVAESKTWHGTYEVQGNPHLTDTSKTSFNSQISSVFRHPYKKDLYIAIADRWLPELPKIEGNEFYTGEAYEKTHKKFEEIFDPAVEFVFTEEDAKAMKINSSMSDYVWLPIKFENDRVYIEWKEEWRIADYE